MSNLVYKSSNLLMFAAIVATTVYAVYTLPGNMTAPTGVAGFVISVVFGWNLSESLKRG